MKLQIIGCLVAVAIFANVHDASAANKDKAEKNAAVAKDNAKKNEKKADAKAERTTGKVTSVDVDKNTIKLSVGKKNNAEEKEFKLDEKCRVTINGEKKGAADVEVGSRAVIISKDGQTAKSIVIGAKKKKDPA